MTEKERLIELIIEIENILLEAYPYTTDSFRINETAEHLLANGIIVAPTPMSDWLREELIFHINKRCEQDGG